MQKITIPIKGMHCKSCELLIEEKLKDVRGVEKCEVSHVSGKAKIWYEGKQPSINNMSAAIEQAGYAVGQEDNKHFFSHNPRDYYYLANAAAILMLLFIAVQMFGLSEINTNFNQKTIAIAGIVGLVAGVSSCMALIGGLVLALSTRHSEQHPEATRWEKFRPHLFFNLGRVIGFAFFGGIVGIVGGALQPSARALALLTIAVGAVMILLGLKLVEIFPILKRINITLPKFISRLLGSKKTDSEYSHRGAFIGGALTFFLPCGFTQAMQLFAISTGSFTQGAAIMSLFALGTAPGLLGIGGLSSAFKGTKARIFFATAGLAVILLGIYNISNASRIAFPPQDTVATSATAGKEAQIVNTVYTRRNDIAPAEFTVKAGQPVKFIVDAKEGGSGCMSTIMIPGLYNKPLYLEKGAQIVMEFTPAKAGSYPITCAMGIKRGTLTVE